MIVQVRAAQAGNRHRRGTWCARAHVKRRRVAVGIQPIAITIHSGWATRPSGATTTCRRAYLLTCIACATPPAFPARVLVQASTSIVTMPIAAKWQRYCLRLGIGWHITKAPLRMPSLQIKVPNLHLIFKSMVRTREVAPGIETHRVLQLFLAPLQPGRPSTGRLGQTPAPSLNLRLPPSPRGTISG